MNPTIETLPPIVHTGGLERLDWVDWDEVHEAVQSTLRDLDGLIRRDLPSARASSGRNSAPTWHLFSYRVFHNDALADVDPIVAGITFRATESGAVSVGADLCGETIGDVLFDCPDRSVVGQLALIEAARDMGEQLVRNHARIVAALTDAARVS